MSLKVVRLHVCQYEHLRAFLALLGLLVADMVLLHFGHGSPIDGRVTNINARIQIVTLVVVWGHDKRRTVAYLLAFTVANCLKGFCTLIQRCVVI